MMAILKKLLALLCLFALVGSAFAKKASKKDSGNKSGQEKSAPLWLTDEGRVAAFPLNKYLSAVASGDSAESAKASAQSDLGTFIKAQVVTVKEGRRKVASSAGVTTDDAVFAQNTTINSDNLLFSVQYTVPFYNEAQGVYYCAAFIERKRAYDFVAPKLENALAVFPPLYQKALQKESAFEKWLAIKDAQKVLKDFYEVWDFARAVFPAGAQKFEALDKSATASFSKAVEVSRAVKIFVTANNDDGGKVAAAVEGALGKAGFTVTKGAADFQARATLDFAVKKAGSVYAAYPALTVEVVTGEKVLYSYAADIGKVAAFDEEAARRAVYAKVAKDIETGFLVF